MVKGGKDHVYGRHVEQKLTEKHCQLVICAANVLGPITQSLSGSRQGGVHCTNDLTDLATDVGPLTLGKLVPAGHIAFVFGTDKIGTWSSSEQEIM